MFKKIFITDFDGTLLTDAKKVHPEDIQTLQQLKDNKIITAIATGRSLASIMTAFTDMGMAEGPKCLSVDYIIFSTGAGILEVENNDLFYQKSIPVKKIRTITDFLDEQEMDYMVHAAIPDNCSFLYRSHGKDNPDFYRRIAIYNSCARPLAKAYQHKTPISEVLVILPDGQGFDKFEKIKHQLPDLSVIQATSPLDHKSVWIEIFHKDVSKSKTAAFLAKKLGVEPSDVISVGNDYNDQDLLEWSGKGFMVENGPKVLKEKFETVSSNNQCGVTQAVRKSGLLGQDMNVRSKP
ncbi:MAG: HAD family hydrolase [Pseudomonadota bacterium]